MYGLITHLIARLRLDLAQDDHALKTLLKSMFKIMWNKKWAQPTVDGNCNIFPQ